MKIWHARIAGWSAIAAVTALLFLLDTLRMVNFHFNWFVAILLTVSAALVALIVALNRHKVRAASPPSEPAQDRTT